MVTYNENETRIIDHFKHFTSNPRIEKNKYLQYLEQIPDQEKNYKCYNCFTILSGKSLKNNKCPVCGENVTITQMCPLDHNHCSHYITTTIEYCPVCAEAICPVCGDHNVMQVSRITGYMQDVSGFR